MNIKKTLCLMVLFLCSFIISAENNVFTSPDDPLYFDEIYFMQIEYRPGEKAAEVPRKQEFLYHDTILPESNSPEIREFVFETSFFIDSQLEGESLGLFVGSTDYPAELYLNGVLIYQSGEYEDRYNSMNYRSQTVFLPRDLLEYGDSENILSIQIYPTYERHPLFRTFISTDSAVNRKVFFYSFLNYHFIQASMVLSVFLSFFFFLMYIKGNFKERTYLYFALINFFYGLAYTNIGFDFPSNNEVLIEILSRFTFPFVACMLLFFFMEFTKILHKNKIIKLVLIIIAVIAGIITSFQKTKFGIQSVFVYTRNLFITPILLFIPLMLIYSVLKRRQNNLKIILIACLIQTVFGIHDSMYINLNRTPVFWLIPYGYSILIISIFIVLAIDQSRMYFRLHQQKEDLALSRKEIALRRNTEKKLRDAVKEADAANNAKSMFLANMSHEIRTPLSAILGYSEIIAKGENASEHSRYASVMHRESQHLMQLVNKVLDISKIESGKLSIEFTGFNIRNIIGDISISFSERCGIKGIDFKLFIDDTAPDNITSDIVRVQQIVTNLLENALKFTEKGSIHLSVWAEEAIFVSVKDTGIGIEKSKLEKIFESFVQADNSTTRKYGGTGLGISISKELAKRLGGDISVISSPGRGSEFILSLPLYIEDDKLGASAVDEEIEIPDFSKYRVLIVEDNKTNQEVVQLNLRKTNIFMITADNGQQGVDFYRSEKPDLILMDVQMPVLDGYQATSIIRGLPDGAHIPIIGLTANAFEHDRQLCLESGMNDVLTKPIKQEGLFTVLARFLNGYPDKEEHGKISLSLLQKELEIDKSTALDLISGFIDESRKGINNLDNAIEQDNWKTAHREAHSIKGGSLNIHADGVFKAARETEQLCLEQKSRKARASMPRLTKQIDILEKELENLVTEG